MIIHHNSQKRIYKRNGIYFITTVTYNRFPYFNEKVFYDLLNRIIYLNLVIKKFILFVYTIQSEHLHLLLQPRGKNNISEIMRSIKTNSSRDINKILRSEIQIGGEGGVSTLRLHKMKLYPDFKWQESYYDHLIRNNKDFVYHYRYIKNHKKIFE